jgi:hypothetical protein
VIFLIFLAALPTLYWDGAPESRGVLEKAGILTISVPGEKAPLWRGQQGITAEAVDLKNAVKLTAPEVKYRFNEAAATRSPWLETGAWNYLRAPEKHYWYEAPGAAAALAAAEAFMFGGRAAIRTDPAGVEILGGMLQFLRGLKPAELPAQSNIGVIDDGSTETSELMKLLIRRNLLFSVLAKPDPHFALNVRIGSKEYPKSEAADPSRLVQRIRQGLGDEKRLVRVYGSEVVVARFVGNGRQARVHLLNYAGPSRPVRGLRVRVLGNYSRAELSLYQLPGARAIDVVSADGGIEFTLEDLNSYGVVDLSR